jgi:hypothetical protein
MSYMIFPVDHRSPMEPPLPDMYLTTASAQHYPRHPRPSWWCQAKATSSARVPESASRPLSGFW